MDRPKVGIAVILRRDGKVLFGKRRNAHGKGSWGFPGGHLEGSENFEDCAAREVREETGMTIKNSHFGAITNDIFTDEEKHYTTIYMVADALEGKPKLLEPEKCERWEWYAWDQLPSPLFLPITNLLKQHFNPFDV